MIRYQLRCSDDHRFEGWFKDSATFEQNARRGLLSCPECGTVRIDRALMAPAVRSSRRKAPEPLAGGPEPDVAAASVPAMLPDQLRAALQRLRAEVERHCDDVGDGFAEAARRLHRRVAGGEGDGEADGDVKAGHRARRGIYGRVTEAEREALADEGIETAQIPWLPRADG